MEENTQIQITNLPPDFTESMLIDKFKTFGRIIEYGFKKSRNEGGSRAGIITFQNPADAANAIQEMNEKVFDGFTVTVNYRQKRSSSNQHEHSHERSHSHSHSHSSHRHESHRERHKSSTVQKVQQENDSRREKRSIKEESSSSDTDLNEEADVEYDSPPPVQRKKSTYVQGKSISQNLIRIYHQILIQNGVPANFQLDYNSIRIEKELDNQLWQDAQNAYSH